MQAWIDCYTLHTCSISVHAGISTLLRLSFSPLTRTCSVLMTINQNLKRVDIFLLANGIRSPNKPNLLYFSLLRELDWFSDFTLSQNSKSPGVTIKLWSILAFLTYPHQVLLHNFLLLSLLMLWTRVWMRTWSAKHLSSSCTFQDDTIYFYSNLSFQLRLGIRPPLPGVRLVNSTGARQVIITRFILTFFGASMEMELRSEQNQQLHYAIWQSQNAKW